MVPKTEKFDLSEVSLATRMGVKRRLRGLSKVNSAEKRAKITDTIERDLDKARALYALREAQRPEVSYPEQLPVSQKREDIAAAIRDHQVVVVAGETGSGKTTQLPKICLELGLGRDGMIGHTQPRRLAARSVATRIAEELDSPLGEAVGFKVRFSDHTKDTSYVKLMTDGILLAEIQHDRMLSQYDTLIIDEAHERSLNIDFILGYLKQLLPKRPDLKVIITSATIDVERFSRHFENAPVIQVSGRTYPVEVRYRPINEEDKDRDQLQAIFDAVDELYREKPGDILIFMNGEREIRDTADALNKRQLPHTEILPLYARLSAAEQNRIFQSHGGRRIVLSTNVAETSLTVPGIRYVIDPGTARISRYSYRTKVQRLPIEAISQASANQRKGRCGRVAEGICIRLYSEEDFNGRSEFTDPEILRTNLASVILQMLSLGLGDIQAFPFVQPPDSRNINDGMRLLEELTAIEKVKRHQVPKMTPLGRQLSRLPIDPRLGRMVLAAQEFSSVREMMIITSALSIQDPRERPLEKQQAADESHGRFADKGSDFAAFLNLWHYLEDLQDQLSRNQFRKRVKQEFLNYLRLREWQDIYAQLSASLDDLNIKPNTVAADSEAVHKPIIAGLLSHIGNKDQKSREYFGARNSKFLIFPGSGLAKSSPKWLMTAELVETSRLFARTVAKIEKDWIAPFAQHLVNRSYAEPQWDEKRGNVVAFEKQTLYGLVIVDRKPIQYKIIKPVEAREIFIREALVNQRMGRKFDFIAHNQALIEEMHRLEAKQRRRDILADEDELFAFYDEQLPSEIADRASFTKWHKEKSRENSELLKLTREALMKHAASDITANSFPDVWIQDKVLLPLDYVFEPASEADGLHVIVPLPLLNQVKDLGFDWLVPGMRIELATALIKSLPKPVRRNFVPAPDVAKAAVDAITAEPEDESFVDALSYQLRRMTGVSVDKKEWGTLPLHLRPLFVVQDEHGKTLKSGRHLGELQQSLQDKLNQTLSEVAQDGIEQQGLTEWSFEDLPEEYQQVRGQFEIKAYPALVDKKSGVDIALFDDKAKADEAHLGGLRRLLLMSMPSPIKHLQAKLPNKAKLAMYQNPFGSVTNLIDDCIAAACNKLLQDKHVRDRSEFDAIRDEVRAEINEQTLKVALEVEHILRLAHGIAKKLKGKADLTMIQAQGDIKAQLQSLVYKGFVSDIGWQRLVDVQRYLQALEKRLEKLAIDPNKDRLAMLEVSKAEQAYQSTLKEYKHKSVPESLGETRWMLQELRVSLFAQTLGTAYPISAKRVLNHLSQFK